MEELRPPPARLDWAYFLDVDGTLLEIAASPEAVRVPADLVAILDRLHRETDGALALLSGRRIADLDALFEPLKLPAAGVHGLERRRADEIVESATPVGVLAALRELQPLLAEFVAEHPGLRLEDKGVSLALHYRQAPEFEGAVHNFAERIAVPYADRLRLLPGKMVVELKPHGADKGIAIAEFMAEPPFAGRHPVFIGDDVTDEDGFRAVNALGGLSLRIGDERPSAAHARLPSVDLCRTWLAAAVAAERPPKAGRSFPGA
ncbi:MAG: trehalose-6-phosphate phophatase, biosynthetic [Rhodospirillales bacterium]|nr:trehalose-6-phosphate phophatase, biosynthetic [Rhodospirillales bacterium]